MRVIITNYWCFFFKLMLVRKLLRTRFQAIPSYELRQRFIDLLKKIASFISHGIEILIYNKEVGFIKV